MGDVSPMLSAPLLSEVPNGVSSHSFNNTDDLDDEASNASLYLINQIASSLSNPQTMNAPSPRLSSTLDRQHATVETSLPCDTRASQAPSSLTEEDTVSFLPSYKRVSKLNKKNPVISCMLEENPQFVIDPVNIEKDSDSTRLPLANSFDTPVNEAEVETIEEVPQQELTSNDMLEDSVREDQVSASLVTEETRPRYDLDSMDMETSTEPTISNTMRKDSESADTAGTLEAFNSRPPLSHTTSSSSGRSALEDENDSSILLIEKRSFRPFKNPEDYLYAMREDLAEWLNSMYELDITADNFFEKLETGEVLCQVERTRCERCRRQHCTRWLSREARHPPRSDGGHHTVSVRASAAALRALTRIESSQVFYSMSGS